MINFLLNPIIHGGLLILLWMFFRSRGKILTARLVGGLFLGWMGLIFLTPLPAYLVGRMERQYMPLDGGTLDPAQIYDVLVLGAGKVSDPALPATSQLDGTVMMRMVDGIRLYRQLPSSQLVTSASAVKSATPQAKTVADAAVSLGVYPSDTIQLTLPTTTRTEAFAYKARLSADQKPLILVTSALHMPRAVRWFQHAGIEVIPAPCAERVQYIMSKIAPSGITGNTSVGRLINDSKLIELATVAMDKLFVYCNVPVHGFFTVDFKEDDEGIPFITEINVRHVAFSLCFAMAGSNFAEDTVRLLDADPSFNTNYMMYEFEEGQMFLRDVDALPIHLKENELL